MIKLSIKNDDRCLRVLQTTDGINEVCIMQDGNAFIGVLTEGYKAGCQTRDFDTLAEIVSFFNQIGYVKEIML